MVSKWTICGHQMKKKKTTWQDWETLDGWHEFVSIDEQLHRHLTRLEDIVSRYGKTRPSGYTEDKQQKTDAQWIAWRVIGRSAYKKGDSTALGNVWHTRLKERQVKKGVLSLFMNRGETAVSI